MPSIYCYRQSLHGKLNTVSELQAYPLKDITKKPDGGQFSIANHLGPAMIHSALSITVGIDFMMGKSREKETSRERKHIIFYIIKCEAKESPFWCILQCCSLCVIICETKRIEYESLIVKIASQSAVKEIRGGILF